jgi:hypothetical protein
MKRSEQIDCHIGRKPKRAIKVRVRRLERHQNKNEVESTPTRRYQGWTG